MWKSILLYTSLLVVSGYNLLHNYIPTEITKTFYMCPNANPILRETANEIVDNINQYNILFVSLNSGFTEPIFQNGINEICDFNEYRSNFGYTTTQGNNETDIYISELLMYTPTTLYNVFYHELLHALGLNHTEEQDGLMNYKLHIERNRIVENTNKLYPSFDDIKGLKYIKNNLCESS